MIQHALNDSNLVVNELAKRVEDEGGNLGWKHNGGEDFPMWLMDLVHCELFYYFNLL